MYDLWKVMEQFDLYLLEEPPNKFNLETKCVISSCDDHYHNTIFSIGKGRQVKVLPLHQCEHSPVPLGGVGRYSRESTCGLLSSLILE